ncbi:MAG TPA: hypothetical protein ENK52_05335 [Saprospiraceae bacterium]|nr:hypothetical protein [Saprospiraceae bacterium]
MAKKNNNKNTTLYFWLFFVLCNCFIFLPKYFLNIDITNLISITNMSIRSVFEHVNQDFLRLSGEFFLLSSLLFFFKEKRWFSIFLTICFFLLISYQAYYEFSIRLYEQVPSFQNDYLLIRQVLPIFLSNRGIDSPIYIISAIIVLLLAIALGIFLVSQMIKHFRGSKKTRIIYAIIMLYHLVSFSQMPINNRNANIQWSLPKIAQSLDTKSFEPIYLKEKKNIYSNLIQKNLVQKPNVYLLVIEAYGGLVCNTSITNNSYKENIGTVKKILDKNGWKTTSNLSRSTIFGGRSWLGFSTIMTGMKIENQIQYNQLLFDNNDFPHMIRFFNQQEYQTYRLSTLSASKAAKKRIPQQTMHELWEYNKWLQFDDIPYHGIRYNSFGGIPDQYALSYFNNQFTNKNNTPQFLFFITMNSHTPWYKPPPILDNWQSFDSISNNKATNQKSLDGSTIERYQKTIEYELNFITKFITEEADSNSIFILVGDHQPAGLGHFVMENKRKFDCPIHIVSKNENFIHAFEKYGFVEGMYADPKKVTSIRHEDIYEMFTKEMISVFGNHNSSPE